MLGLEIDEPIESVVARLSGKGVDIKGDIIRGEAGSFAHLDDPDGNEIYLWEVDRATVTAAEPEYAHAGTV